MADKPKDEGFGEARGRFATDALTSVFAAYEYACAFTGHDLRIEGAADPRGYLLNLSGNPLSEDRTMLVPAVLEAIHAFERGHIAIGPRYNFLVDLEFIDPEFLERLNPIGRLRVPFDTAFHPAQSGLTPHLIAFSTGRRQRI
jgi:hypothetical protein